MRRFRFPVEAGSSAVPAGPGLGVDVDEERLQRLAALPKTQVPRFIGITHLPGGHRMYTRSFPSIARQTGFNEGTTRGIHLEVWEDDGGDDFAAMWQETESGAVWRG